VCRSLGDGRFQHGLEAQQSLYELNYTIIVMQLEKVFLQRLQPSLRVCCDGVMYAVMYSLLLGVLRRYSERRESFVTSCVHRWSYYQHRRQ